MTLPTPTCTVRTARSSFRRGGILLAIGLVSWVLILTDPHGTRWTSWDFAILFPTQGAGGLRRGQELRGAEPPVQISSRQADGRSDQP